MYTTIIQQSILFCSITVLIACKQKANSLDIVNESVHTFYYNWYASPELDGQYAHWDHEVLPHWSDTTWNNAGKFSGGNNIGANFFPELGCYSSNDTAVIEKHFSLMKEAKIGVCVISWWGKDSFEDQSIPLYLNVAKKHGLKIAFHLEPFYKSVKEVREQLTYIHQQYGKHSALFTPNGKPLFYIYDSYKINEKDWSKLLTTDGSLSIRNTKLDATMIGLWVEENEHDFFLHSGFDGFYTYFASDGFVYGSTTSNWPILSTFAKQNDLIFIPCVGPGYKDTRIRPWNNQNSKEREGGNYYEKMFRHALRVKPKYIGITSFNEWHEGTQIEPAIPKTISDYSYEDYGENIDPNFYIRKTRDLVNEYKSTNGAKE